MSSRLVATFDATGLAIRCSGIGEAVVMALAGWEIKQGNIEVFPLIGFTTATLKHTYVGLRLDYVEDEGLTKSGFLQLMITSEMARSLSEALSAITDNIDARTRMKVSAMMPGPPIGRRARSPRRREQRKFGVPDK